MSTLRYSDNAMKMYGKTKEEREKAKQAAEQTAKDKRERKREEQRVAHERAKAAEKVKRDRAHASDTALATMLDGLEQVETRVASTRKQREHDELCAAARRAEVKRLQAELATAQTDLETLEARIAKPEAEDIAATRTAAGAAWTEHTEAWNAVSPAYKKKHRDRAVRKRAKEAGINRQS